jgi:hypothetical protein
VLRYGDGAVIALKREEQMVLHIEFGDFLNGQPAVTGVLLAQLQADRMEGRVVFTKRLCIRTIRIEFCVHFHVPK